MVIMAYPTADAGILLKHAHITDTVCAFARLSLGVKLNMLYLAGMTDSEHETY